MKRLRKKDRRALGICIYDRETMGENGRHILESGLESTNYRNRISRKSDKDYNRKE